MADTVTLEQVEVLAAQLPYREQLKLLARISERLSQLPSPLPDSAPDLQRRQYAEQVETSLAACDEAAEQIEGEFDSAKDLRQIREERTEQL